MPSPCGPNCTYDIAFDAPYLQCVTAISNVSSNINGSEPNPSETTAYEGVWTPGGGFDSGNLNITLASPMASWKFEQRNLSVSEGSSSNVTMISCTPSRATYKMKNSYINNLQNAKFSLKSVRSILLNASVYPEQEELVTIKSRLMNIPVAYIPGLVNDHNEVKQLGIDFASWNASALSWYSDLQLLALLNAMGQSMNGTYAAVSTTLNIDCNKALVKEFLGRQVTDGHGKILACHTNFLWTNSNISGMPFQKSFCKIAMSALNSIKFISHRHHWSNSI